MTRLSNFTITLIDDAIKAHSNNNVKELIEKIAKQREKDQSILEECLKELQAYADEDRDIGESGQTSHDEETSTLSRGITSEEITITATVITAAIRSIKEAKARAREAIAQGLESIRQGDTNTNDLAIKLLELKSVKVNVPKLPKADQGAREYNRFEKAVWDALVQAEPMKERELLEYWSEYNENKSSNIHNWEANLSPKLKPVDRSLFQGLKSQLQATNLIHDDIITQTEAWKEAQNNGRRLLRTIRVEFNAESVEETGKIFNEWENLCLEKTRDLRKFLIDVRRFEAALRGSEYELPERHIFAKIINNIAELESEDSPIAIIVEKFKDMEGRRITEEAPLWRVLNDELAKLIRRHPTKYSRDNAKTVAPVIRNEERKEGRDNTEKKKKPNKPTAHSRRCKWCEEPDHNWKRQCKVFPHSAVFEQENMAKAIAKGWKTKPKRDSPTATQSPKINGRIKVKDRICLDSGAQIDAFDPKFLIPGTERDAPFACTTILDKEAKIKIGTFYIPSLGCEREGVISTPGMNCINPSRMHQETGHKWVKDDKLIILNDQSVIATIEEDHVQFFPAEEAAVKPKMKDCDLTEEVLTPKYVGMLISTLTADSEILPAKLLKETTRGRKRKGGGRIIHACIHLPADPRNCRICLLAKMRKTASLKKTRRTPIPGGAPTTVEEPSYAAKDYGDHMTMDWSYSTHPTVHGHRAISILLDSGTGWIEGTLSKKHPNAEISTRSFKKLTAGTAHVKHLRTDAGPEFRGDFHKAMEDMRTLHTFSVPGVSQSNGRIESHIRIINQCIRAKLLQAWLPHIAWGYAAKDTFFDINRYYRNGEDKTTAYERRYGKKFEEIPAFPFGCEGIFLRPEKRRREAKVKKKKALPLKYDKTGIVGAILGRSYGGYIVLDVEELVNNKKWRIEITRDVKVNRGEFPGRTYNLLNIASNFEINTCTLNHELCEYCDKAITDTPADCPKCQNPNGRKQHLKDFGCIKQRCVCNIDQMTPEDSESFRITAETIDAYHQLLEDEITDEADMPGRIEESDSEMEEGDEQGNNEVITNLAAAITSTENIEATGIEPRPTEPPHLQEATTHNQVDTQPLTERETERNTVNEETLKEARFVEPRRSSRHRIAPDLGPVIIGATKAIPLKAAILDQQGIAAINQELKSLRAHTALGKPTEKEEAQKDSKSVFTCMMMTVVMKHAELSKEYQKIKGRGVLRGDLLYNNEGRRIKPFPVPYDKPAGMEAIRMLTLYSASKPSMDYIDADVNTAFLQAPYGAAGGVDHKLYVSLDPRVPREVYMKAMNLDESFLQMKDPVFPVIKSIYGTNRGQSDFAEHLRVELKQGGWEEIKDVELGLFKKEVATGEKAIIAAYIDDIRIAGEQCQLIPIITEIGRKIDVKEPSKEENYIGVRYTQQEIPGGRIVRADLSDYTRYIVEKVREIYPEYISKNVNTPMIKLTAEEIVGEHTQPGVLRQQAPKIIGMLLWIARNTRPDISYAVHALSTRLHDWSKLADIMMIRVIQYLEKTSNYGMESTIIYSDEGKMSLHVQTDSDFAGCLFSGRSTTGYVVQMIGPNGTRAIIDWGSKRQSRAGSSSAEVETTALDYAINTSVLPLIQIFEFIYGYAPEVTVEVDNNATIDAIHSGYSLRMRHLPRSQRVSIARLHELFNDEELHMTLQRVDTEENTADVFTKAVDGTRLKKMTRNLSLLEKEQKKPYNVIKAGNKEPTGA